MENNKISIIIPMYNTSKFISACLDSLTTQIGAESTEIIVVNDGSTDSSREIAQKYIISHSGCNIRLINQENKGVSASRNNGVSYATGEYILFVDSDDYLLPGCIERINKEIDKKKYDIVLFGLYTSNEEGKIISARDENLDYKGEVCVPEDNRLITIPLVAYCKAFNREWYINNEISFAEGLIHEEVSIIPYALSKANYMYVCEERYYVYRQRIGSTMNKKADASYLDVLKGNEVLRDRFVKDGTFDKYRDEIESIAIKTIVFQVLLRVNATNPSSKLQDTLMRWIEMQYPTYLSNKYITNDMHKKLELFGKRKYKEYYLKYGLFFNMVKYAKNHIPSGLYKMGSDIKNRRMR